MRPGNSASRPCARPAAAPFKGTGHGSAGDILGTARGESDGFALHSAYDAALPVRGKRVKVHFDYWMYMLDADTVLNRSVVTKFGVRVGEAPLAFHRLPATAENLVRMNAQPHKHARPVATPVAIVWFRRDLRLADNPALQAALDIGARIIPVYIHAPAEEAPWQPGAASRWWLHHSLSNLDRRLAAFGGRLIVRRGPTLATLRELISETGAGTVHWNRLHEPAIIERDCGIREALRADGLEVRSHNAALLFEPWTLATRDGRPYRVFTPFWKACQQQGLPDNAYPAPRDLPLALARTLRLDELGLLPAIPWYAGFDEHWLPGEAGARRMLHEFLEHAASIYTSGRDRPGETLTSRLSPHLHFGEIGPRQIVATVATWLAGMPRPELVSGLEAFLRELGWREFSHHLLYHFPFTPEHSLNERFADFPWLSDQPRALAAWQRGRTGIPLVDAGMRELWQTGWMHNRVRMVAASFLTKNLLIPWQAGARWFWDTLLDADLANNTQGWQWTAGCGADAAPYFRVFNPVLQGRKFDPEGRYVRRWLPELAKLPNRHLHAPWEASTATLRAAGVTLGAGYPWPIVETAASRARALAAYETIKQE